MPAYLDFEKDVKAGNLRNVYFVMALDNYFISRAGAILREKLFGSAENKENFFLRYGDESSAEEILDLCSNFSSLFSASKLIIVKRCEKYAKKFALLTDYIKNPDKDTTLLLCFDKEYVIEKKLDKEFDFYDFSELSDKEHIAWIKSEFEKRKCTIESDALELFISLTPLSFDLAESEIEKLCLYTTATESNLIKREIVEKFAGYSEEYSPDQLIYSIVHKNGSKSLEILDKLLNNGGINEVFLLSILTNYYLDLLSFKTKGFGAKDGYGFFGKYKMWGERLKFAKTFHNLLDENRLKYSLSRLLETDLKLKTSMLDSKILMASLIEDLVNFS